MHTITLPDALHAAVEHLADQAGFRSVDEYVAELVRRELEESHRQDSDANLRQALAEGTDPARVAEEDLLRRKQEITAKLLEGLDSGPATPMTGADWETLRQRVAARLAQQDAP